MLLLNERTQEIINENELKYVLIKYNFLNINELYLKIPGWKKSNKIMLSTNEFPNDNFKEIFVSDFDKRSLNVLEDSLVNVYKKLFNVCLKEIKDELKDDFEII